MKLKELDEYLKDLLQIKSIPDAALNGLQVGDAHQEIKTLALAVDTSLDTLLEASEKGADLLLAHHGLFWGKSFALTGPDYDKIKILTCNPMSLYAVHLPLDLHAPYGNNYQIAQKLGLKGLEPFGSYHGVFIGFGGEFEGSFEELQKRCSGLSSTFRPLEAGEKVCRRVAVVSGKGGADILGQFIQSSYDVLITGEMEHALYNLALDWRKNVMALGHYESEKYGVLALGAHLQEVFGLNAFFIHRPTGY